MSLHMMIDLETLGSTANCPIVQIGIALFDPEKDKVHSKVKVNILPDLTNTKVDFSTIQWWMEQSEEARRSVFDKEHGRVPLEDGLKKIVQLWEEWCDESSLVWAAPAQYDLSIVDASFERCGIKPPYPFRNKRCFSSASKITGFTFNKAIIPTEYDLAHDAGCDAARQAMYVQQFLKWLKTKGIKPRLW